MSSLANILVLGLPVLLLVLLTGLVFGVLVLVREGQGRILALTRAAGWINLALTAPLLYLALVSDTRDVQLMFGFCGVAFAVVGAMDLRFAARF